MVVVYVVDQQLASASSLLPSNKNRSLVAHSLITARLSKHPNIRFRRPVPADIKSLAVYHTKDFLEHLLDPSHANVEDDHEVYGLEDDCPPFKGLHLYVPLVAGASLTAADALKRGEAEVAIAWDGGRHHAQKSHASGYCYVADCVLSILSLKRGRARVMYLDLDLHFSDGVTKAFHVPGNASSQVLTLSIHHSAPGFFPVSELSALPDTESETFDPFTLSLPLQVGASNGTYARIWPLVERVKDMFKPDYVVVQCGVDGLAGDPCATFNWGLGGHGSMGWCLSQIVEWNAKKLLLGGGGYNTPNAARAWAYFTSIALGEPLGLDEEIPDHKAFELYTPSFTFDVPKGNMVDRNTDEYLTVVEERFMRIAEILGERYA